MIYVCLVCADAVKLEKILLERMKNLKSSL